MYTTRRFSYCLLVTSNLLQFWFIKTRAEGQAAGRAGPTIDPAFARPKIERKLRSSNKVFFWRAVAGKTINTALVLV